MEVSPKHRIPSLDGIRAVSIGLVILSHAVGYPDKPAWTPRFGFYGQTGVRIFFVISGFLITTLLLNERARTGTISLRAFYQRRLFRILPANYAAIALIAICWPHRVHLGDILFSALYVQNYNPHRSWALAHMWSLAVEEQFYLIWPLLLLRFPQKAKQVVLAAVIAAPLFRVAFAFFGMHAAETLSFPACMDGLAFGCLLALYKDKAASWLGRMDGLFLPAVLTVIAIPQFTYPRGVQQLAAITLSNVAIAFCVEHCIRKRFGALNWRPVAWLGTLSYSLYLVQMPFFDYEHPHVYERAPLNLLCIALSALACHYFVEKPFLGMRDRFRGRAKRLKASVAGHA